ncbi:MAG TPA: hypothetical protein VEJ84_10435, partial [Acidimicrobiales bacterium]|nr:hypothetical protein [Acidimicrobiales bacterium]
MNVGAISRALPLACVVALGLSAAACGGGPPRAAVAHIGSPTTASTSLAGPSVTSLGELQSARLAFAQCMRSHGVPEYPDPGSQG